MAAAALWFRPIHMCDMTHSHVQHTTHSYVCIHLDKSRRLQRCNWCCCNCSLPVAAYIHTHSNTHISTRNNRLLHVCTQVIDTYSNIQMQLVRIQMYTHISESVVARMNVSLQMSSCVVGPRRRCDGYVFKCIHTCMGLVTRMNEACVARRNESRDTFECVVGLQQRYDWYLFKCVTWLIHMCTMCLIQICGMAHSYVYHIPHANVWHDSFMCITCLIQMCHKTRSCV